MLQFCYLVAASVWFAVTPITPAPVVPATLSSTALHLAAAPARSKGKKKKKTNAAPMTQKQTKKAPPVAASTRKLAPPPPLPVRYKGVAVLPLQTYEVEDGLAETIEQALLNEIDELQGLQSISPQDVINETQGYGLDVNACDRELQCLAQLGRYSRAHLAIEVRLSGLGGSTNIALRLMDTVKASEIARVAEHLTDEPQARLQQTHRLAVQMLNPNAYVGDLSVTCPTAGAEVYLDDRLLGQTPLPAQKALPAGLHVLRVSKPGYSDINRFVDVVYNRASTVQVDFNDNTVAGVVVEQKSETGFGELFIATEEEGLEIRIDGEPVAVTPMRGAMTKVAAGTRHITLRKPGQPPVVMDLVIKPQMRTDAVLKAAADGGPPVLTPLPPVLASQPLPNVQALLHPEVAAAQAAAKAAAQPPPLVMIRDFPTWRYYTGLCIGGVGVASLVASSLFARTVASDNKEAAQIVANSKTANWDLATRTAMYNRLNQLNREGPQAELKQWVTLGAGAALLGTGVGFILWDVLRPPHPAPQPDVVAPSPGVQLHLNLQGTGVSFQLLW